MTRQQTTNVIVPYSKDKYYDHMAIMTLMLSHYWVYKGLEPHRFQIVKDKRENETFVFFLSGHYGRRLLHRTLFDVREILCRKKSMGMESWLASNWCRLWQRYNDSPAINSCTWDANRLLQLVSGSKRIKQQRWTLSRSRFQLRGHLRRRILGRFLMRLW